MEVNISPHPLFDPVWYRNNNMNLTEEECHFEHYRQHGWRSLKSPHILFSVEYYLSQRPDVLHTSVEPLEHFVTVGWREGANPHPAFDTKQYLRQAVDTGGLDPLTHFITKGCQLGLSPVRPSTGIDMLLTIDAAKVGSRTSKVVRAINAHIMRASKLMPELRQVFLELVHRNDTLASTDFDEDRPNPEEFDEDGYLASYPDLRRALRLGIISSALEHWLVLGFQEELNGSREGSWRGAIGLTALKSLIASAVVDARHAVPAELPVTSTDIKPYLIRWQRTSRMVNALKKKPLISILMPVYNVDVRWLELAIESVYWQIYENWELCIVDDCSSNKDILPVLHKWAGTDDRIRVKSRSRNGHISAASNDALHMARGSYVALLDNDDELTVDALARVAAYIDRHENVDYIYSDEDKIDEAGSVFGRFFKPAWSPEFLLSCGYTTHLSVYRKDMLMRVGGFRSEYDGAQDYDLVLRATRATSEVGHIPHSLYHWRISETSTAGGNQAKNYAFPRAKEALKAHMQRIGHSGNVTDGILPGYTRPTFALRGKPLVSLVIPTGGKIAEINGRTINLVENFVRSIREKSTYANKQLVVVENGNLAESTIDRLGKYGVRFVPYREEVFNIAQKINMGVRHCEGENVIILNDDMEVISPDWIEQLLQFQQQDGVGVVGAKLLFADGTLQHTGVTISAGNPGHPYYKHAENTVGHGGICTAVHNVTAATGACSMTSRRLFEKVGGYDEEFALNYNDVDYCLRVTDLGYRIVVNPFAVLSHYESVSKDNAGSVGSDELKLFHARWGERYQRERFMRCASH